MISPLDGLTLDPYPLDSLNPESFQTLRCLKLETHHDCQSFGSAQNADPYLGLCKNALPGLVALQNIRIRLCFGGSPRSMLPRLKSFARSQWAELDGMLSVLDRFPRLQHVEIRVVISVFAEEDKVLEETKAAELMMRTIDDHIFPGQFQGLLCRKADSIGAFGLTFRKAVEHVRTGAFEEF